MATETQDRVDLAILKILAITMVFAMGIVDGVWMPTETQPWWIYLFITTIGAPSAAADVVRLIRELRSLAR